MLDIPGCSPMGDRLIVLPIPEKDTMAGAIIIPEFAKNRAIMYRVKIISMGRGKYDLLGRHVPFFVKVGQQCFLNRYGIVTKVVIAGELHYVVRENDLIGIVLSDDKLEPLGDRVLVEEIEAEDMKEGIIIPDTSKDKPQTATVIAVGGGLKDENDELIPFEVKVGDTVLTSKHGGTPVKIGEKKYLLMREGDIMGVIPESKAEE